MFGVIGFFLLWQSLGCYEYFIINCGALQLLMDVDADVVSYLAYSDMLLLLSLCYVIY